MDCVVDVRGAESSTTIKRRGIFRKGSTSELTSNTADGFHHCCWFYVTVRQWKSTESQLHCRLHNVSFLSLKTRGQGYEQSVYSTYVLCRREHTVCVYLFVRYTRACVRVCAYARMWEDDSDSRWITSGRHTIILSHSCTRTNTHSGASRLACREDSTYLLHPI